MNTTKPEAVEVVELIIQDIDATAERMSSKPLFISLFRKGAIWAKSRCDEYYLPKIKALKDALFASKVNNDNFKTEIRQLEEENRKLKEVCDAYDLPYEIHGKE